MMALQRQEAGRSLSVNLTFSSTQINRGTLLVFLCLDCRKKNFLNADFVNAVESIDGVTGNQALVLHGRRISCKW